MATEIKVNYLNGINLNVLNETVEAIKKDPELGKCKFRVRNKWTGATQNQTTISGFYAAKGEQKHNPGFELRADEPALLAGEDQAPNPAEYLLNALVGCTTTSLIAHATVRGIHIEELESEVEGDIDLNGFLGLNPDTPKGYTNIRIKYKVKTDADNLKLLKQLGEFSPMYNTIIHGAKVDFDIEPK